MFWPWQWRQRKQMKHQRLMHAVVQVAVMPPAPPPPRVSCVWPDVVALAQERRYAWCRCGLSADGLWCDGSHRTLSQEACTKPLQPLMFSPPRSQYYWLCTCKQTRTPPYCDASHHRLKPAVSASL